MKKFGISEFQQKTPLDEKLVCRNFRHTTQQNTTMKSKKAFIKLNGEIGEKEQPCIEYVDNGYLQKLEKQKNTLHSLFPSMSCVEVEKYFQRKADNQGTCGKIAQGQIRHADRKEFRVKFKGKPKA